jgi:hypothetical protein
VGNGLLTLMDLEGPCPCPCLSLSLSSRSEEGGDGSAARGMSGVSREEEMLFSESVSSD